MSYMYGDFVDFMYIFSDTLQANCTDGQKTFQI